jgi:hypothetical protein
MRMRGAEGTLRIGASSRVLFGPVLGCVLTTTGSVDAGPWDYSRAHDQYSLFDRRLVNRQLFEQLEEQEYRLGNRWNRFAAASDLSIGTQQTFDDSPQSRYHGWYVADTFIAARIVDGLEANFNLLTLNPSASDGYRESAQVTGALTLHVALDAIPIGTEIFRAELLGLDLGTVTVGQGLLLEQTPIEGVVGVLGWRGLDLDVMYGGRALWSDDDLITTSLSAFDGRVQLIASQWQKSKLPDPVVGTSAWPNEFPQDAPSRYGSLALDLPLPWGFRVAAEHGVRLRDGGLRHGTLLRADYLGPGARWLDVHAGYQFRYYQTGFGPRDRLWAPTSVFNTPAQENAYVTNPFEYFAISERFEQWSHTTMFELRVMAAEHLQFFGNAELWLRYAAAREHPRWVVIAPDDFRAPGMGTKAFYDLGVRYYPWRGLPHRGGAFITNKQVNSREFATDAVATRFDPGFYYVLELEAYL